MKKLVWFIAGLAIGAVAARQIEENPAARKAYDEAKASVSEFRDAVKAVFDNALAGISTSDFEFPLFKDTGERVDVLLSANSRIDESKNVIGVVGVGQVRHCLIQ